jgi:hypothetical protein
LKLITRPSGTGKSREIISNGKDKADSGKKGKSRYASSKEQGSCKESVGNNNGKTVTGMENSENM